MPLLCRFAGSRCRRGGDSRVLTVATVEKIVVSRRAWTRLSTCPLACRHGAAHRRGDELMGRVFGALHTGAGPGVVSTGTRPPQLGASRAFISTETCALHTGPHHHHHPPSSPPSSLLLPPPPSPPPPAHPPHTHHHHQALCTSTRCPVSCEDRFFVRTQSGSLIVMAARGADGGTVATRAAERRSCPCLCPSSVVDLSLDPAAAGGGGRTWLPWYLHSRPSLQCRRLHMTTPRSPSFSRSSGKLDSVGDDFMVCFRLQRSLGSTTDTRSCVSLQNFPHFLE